jgi:hypothetical protein
MTLPGTWHRRAAHFPGVLLLLAAAALQSAGQSAFLSSPRLAGTAGGSSQPPSNSVSHVAVAGDTVWIGTSKGLARTLDLGTSWESFRGVPQFARNGIFSVALRGDTVWTSTGYSQQVEDNSVQTGTGYTFSTDAGRTWNQLPQTLDAPSDSLLPYGANTVYFLPVTVDEQNVTFDIALARGTVWIASWSSGIRRSTDQGRTWIRTVLPDDGRNSIAPTDSLGRYTVDPRRNNNFLGFSVYAQADSIIWAGTAGGINRSTDGGVSWVKSTTRNQQSPILANWVIAIEGQRLDSITRVWCTNWVTGVQGEQFGVSFTDDGGRIWRTALHGVKAYDFAFRGEVAYVAGDRGIYRSSDGGASWVRSGSIVDRRTGAALTTGSAFAVGVSGDTVFCATGEGIARTVDRPGEPFGTTWDVLRASQPLPGPGSTYAYPNPFSPDDEVVRIRYGAPGGGGITIEIFDAGMNRVRTLLKDAARSGPAEFDEIWDGRNDGGTQVSNGVYFYRVIAGGGDGAWGKILVLQ